MVARSSHRKLERELIDEYRGMIERAVATLGVAGAMGAGAAGDREAYERAVEIANLPDMIRGYEEVKEANVERFRTAAAALQA